MKATILLLVIPITIGVLAVGAYAVRGSGSEGLPMRAGLFSAGAAGGVVAGVIMMRFEERWRRRGGVTTRGQERRDTVLIIAAAAGAPFLLDAAGNNGRIVIYGLAFGFLATFCRVMSKWASEGRVFQPQRRR